LYDCFNRFDWIVKNEPNPTNHAYTTAELELHTDQPYLYNTPNVSRSGDIYRLVFKIIFSINLDIFTVMQNCQMTSH